MRRAIALWMTLLSPLLSAGVAPWLAFPGDKRAAAQAQEWMLGSDLLVAPVVTQGARSRIVYVPRGCWRDPQTDLTVHGARSVRVAAPLTRLPFFIRCGTRPLAS